MAERLMEKQLPSMRHGQKGNSVREIPEAVEIAAADSTEADAAAETAAADTKTIRNYKLIQKKQKIHQ